MITIFMFSTCTYIQSITMRSILSINILVSGPESLYHDKSTIDTNPLALWPRPGRTSAAHRTEYITDNTLLPKSNYK